MRRDPKAVEAILYKLKEDGIHPSALVQANLIRALLYSLLDKHLCGYNKEERTSLSANDPARFREYVLVSSI